MKRVGIIAALSALLVALSATAAQAAPHYVAPAGDPVCTVSGNSVSCGGTEIAGVGNKDARATLVASSRVDALCHNPGNDNVVRPHSQTFTDSADTGAIEPTNGRLTVPPVGPVTVPGTTGAACPNPNWRLEITNITRTWTYTLTIGNKVFFQDGPNSF